MGKVMRKAQVGDKVIITNTTGRYYQVGDIGVILCIDGRACKIDFNNQGNKKVIGDGIWWAGYYSDDCNKIALYGENKLFSSQQDIWKYLDNGGEVTRINGTRLFFFKNKQLVTRRKDTGEICRSNENFSRWQDFEVYVKKPEWYENIPEQGILCWVSDSIVDKQLYIVKYYRQDNKEYPYTTDDGRTWKHAVPLTDEEIKQYIYKQN